MAAASIDIFAIDQIVCALKFEGRNTIGNPQTWVFPAVQLQPGKAISLLSDGWQEIECSGEVILQESSGGVQSFGTITMADGGVAPSTDNYSIGKGVLFVDLSQSELSPAPPSGWIDLGNVSKCEFTITVTKLAHFSSRAGIKTKDREIITERSGTITFVMDELTAQNLALAVMGAVS